MHSVSSISLGYPSEMGLHPGMKVDVTEAKVENRSWGALRGFGAVDGVDLDVEGRGLVYFAA